MDWFMVRFMHEGLLLTVDHDGPPKLYLLERGPDYSKKYGKDVRIVKINNPEVDMEGWELLKEGNAIKKKQIQHFLDAAKPDENYHLLFNNCWKVKNDCEKLIEYLTPGHDESNWWNYCIVL